jgi:F420-non-reducing hydrogenase iron-sulfur subunit
MCSGRVDRDFVLEAFRQGAGMVLVGACHLPYDCHYISGNWKMKSRMDALAPMLEKMGLFCGLESVPFQQPSWRSA